ncbi:MAG: hypothetical protein HY908_27570 [Myxococcales bacterium]|nr:hypothetical protein [Myxococcales bacterium]
MKRAVLLVISAALAAASGGALGAGCSADLAMSALGGHGATTTSSTTTSAGGGNQGGDAGVDADFGGGSSPGGPVDYAELCGEGCLPGTGVSAPCGAGGAGGGVAVGDGVLAFDEAAAEVGGTCAEPGLGELGAPCLSTAYCGPGLACDDGSCRPYCCGALEACPADTYCTPRPVDSGDLPPNLSPVPEVPLCVPVVHCELLSPSSCPPDQSCTIVRLDGTTSCVDPGSHTAGQACPCAPDHYCAAALDTCFALCRTTSNTDCPEGYTCQGGTLPFPEGFGMCVKN